MTFSKFCIVLVIILFFSTVYSEVLDEIKIVVRDMPILKSEIEEGISFIRNSPFFNEQLKDSLVDSYDEILINDKLLEIAAEKDTIFIDEQKIKDEANSRFKELVELNFENEQSFAEFIKLHNISKKQILNFYINQTKRSYIKQQIAMKKGLSINIKESTVKEFYEENIDSFKVPVNIELYHIAIVIQPDSLRMMSAMQKVDALVQSLKMGGDFSSMAKDYSDDLKTRSKGGIIGYTKYEHLPREMGIFLYAFKKADTLIYTQSRDGFHIIKILNSNEDSIKYQHILVSIKPDREDTLRAKSQAESIVKMIRNGEISFHDAAMKFSADLNTAKKGGFVGKLPIENIEGDLKHTLLSLNENEVSNPVMGDFGFDIFFIKEKEGGYVGEYDDVKAMIRSMFEMRELDSKINDIIERQKKSILIKYIE